ncbi:MAG TPA: RHS repeat-associated core domain-containing protein [Pseudomonas sp.]|uniref:RHS repeat domain-containing protein n=1 Tax=Pseudomonas sp. TaxID=306 RepID=UPI002B99273A|nr:RHS repeat-associated core domain-containing protein [Pseudomonas sp.]HWH89819.1 RHS repeat-associated core domain-containing protein [Pseudomonas sp.]
MSIHCKTPTLAVNDPRGLAIRTVNYWRADARAAEPRIERTLRDADGRAVKHWDARLWTLQATDPQTPASLTSVHALNDILLRSDSTDAGIQVQLPGLAGERLFDWDDRGTCRELEYDDLLRPVAVFEEGSDVPRRCAERFAYGRPDAGDPLRNQLGQLIRHDDPAGSVLLEQFAITGQCNQNTRHFTLEPVAPDWPKARVDRHKLLEPGAGATTQWRYAPLGAVLEQLDAGGHQQAFALTLDGRLRGVDLRIRLQTECHPVVSDIRYNAEGQITQELAGNGVLTTLSYCREDGRLVTRHARDRLGTVLQHLLYDYDRMGNVLSIEDKALPVRWFANQRIDPISRFTYDSCYQLRSATGWEAGTASQGPASIDRVDPAAVTNYSQTYRYDESGNLLELTHVGARNGRRLKAARFSNRCLPYFDDVPPTEEAIAAAFDPRGNLRALKGGRALMWNLRNQLQSVAPVVRVDGGNDVEQYCYDGAGLRVRKTCSMQTNSRGLVNDVHYLPRLELRSYTGTAEQLQVIIADGGLNSVRVLHWESAPPSGSNDQYRYTLCDHLESTSLELGEDARIISQETFLPFGETAWSKDTEVSYKTIRYSGKERDATGLYYYGYRCYLPDLQRWLNPDPAGAIDGLNLYRMVRNNPMTYLDADGAETRKKQANGLWTPVLAVGADRDIPGAVPVDAGKPHNSVPFTAKATDIRAALTVPQFSQQTINTDLFMPQKTGYSREITSQLANRQGGGSFIFSMLRVSYSGSVRGEFNAIKVVDIPGGEIPDQSSSVSGYWAAQGGYVDIPMHPKGTEPEYVFTPGFSGCSLTVDQLNDNVLRVRHVEGNKEADQYNRLPSAEHGMGMSVAMEFVDYGFDDEGGKVVNQLTGFAFMKYEHKTKTWDIHYQSNQGAATIGVYSKERKLFGGSKSFASVMEKPKVRRTMSKRAVTVSARPHG